MTMLQTIVIQFLAAQNHVRYIMIESLNSLAGLICMYVV